MGEQIKKEGTTTKDEVAETPAAKDLKNEELEASTDDLMDEIDELLEETKGQSTYEQWVSEFVQRGGQ